MDLHNIIYRSDIVNMINDAREASQNKPELEHALLELIYTKLEELVRKVPDAGIVCPHCGKTLAE